MKKILLSLLITFLLYLSTYYFFGKNNFIYYVVKNQKFEKKENSIHIHLIDIKKSKKTENKIISVIREKGFSEIKISYNQPLHKTKNELNYIISIENMTFFDRFSYDGFYRENQVMSEFESVYIWFFFKWLRVYNNPDNRVYNFELNSLKSEIK